MAAGVGGGIIDEKADVDAIADVSDAADNVGMDTVNGGGGGIVGAVGAPTPDVAAPDVGTIPGVLDMLATVRTMCFIYLLFDPFGCKSDFYLWGS